MNENINDLLLSATIAFVKSELSEAEGGHDWFHIERVWKLSKRIAASEKADLLIVQLGALLHDIADSKFHQGDETKGPKKSRAFLENLNVPDSVVQHVVNIIENISFKGGNEAQLFRSKELDIVQDADRLDAMGAIGIARAFNYGGYKNRTLYDPDIKPNLTMSKEAYKKSSAPTINHFYEKLLLLKDRMNTETGRKMAVTRHNFLELYLHQFYNEWNAKL